MEFFGAYYIAKQVTEIIIDLLVAAYRASALGIGRAWAGSVMPLIRRVIRR